MLDTSCDPDTERLLREYVIAQGGAQKIDRLRTRILGSRIYVDVDIAADGSLSLRE